jgi:regulator of replication initiation timing
MKGSTRAMFERGERRISEKRDRIYSGMSEARAEIDRLYEAERRLTLENRMLREALAATNKGD